MKYEIVIAQAYIFVMRHLNTDVHVFIIAKFHIGVNRFRACILIRRQVFVRFNYDDIKGDIFRVFRCKQRIYTLYRKNIAFNIVVIESNKNLAPYQYTGTKTIYPDVKFGYNKYMNIGIQMTHNEYI